MENLGLGSLMKKPSKRDLTFTLFLFGLCAAWMGDNHAMADLFLMMMIVTIYHEQSSSVKRDDL